MGDDARWVGNESGMGRETEWSATVFAPDAQGRGADINKSLGINSQSKDLGTREMLDKAQELFWYPSEVDVSIRPGWFYHAEQDTEVKSLSQLADIYFQSVGCNSVLLLNIPPDRRGHIHEADSVRLQEFAGYLRETFENNLVLGGDAQWDAASGDEREWKLAGLSRANVIMLQEDLSRGQRVESFTVEGLTANGWTTLCEGTTVGQKRLLRIPETEISSLRIRITGARSTAHICRVGAFLAPEI
jgi:alpha-L-fucosidase